MKLKKIDGTTVLLLIMLSIYLVSIAWINISETPGFYDADMYSDVLYAVKAWEGKSIFPQNWIFGNQLNVVAAPVLAALFYGVLEEPFLAMGLASTVMAVLLLVSMDWMMKPVFPEWNARLVGILTFMSVMLFYNEAVHGLKGWQLFFTMCAYYTGYCITLFLSFGCYLRAVCRIDKGLWVMLILSCILSFGTGMQSIRQTLVMTAPLVGVEFLRLLEAKIHRRKLDKMPLVVTIAIAMSNIAGVFAESQLELPQTLNLGAIKLTPASELPEAIKDAVMTIYSMFVNYDMVSFLLLGGLVLCYTAGIYICIRQVLQKKDWEIAVPMLLLAVAVCAIGAVDILTTMDVAARYYFPMYPLVGLLVAYLYADGAKFVKTAVLLLLVVVYGLSCTQELVPVLRQGMTEDEDYIYEIRDYLVENDYTHLCSIWHLWEPGTKVLVASGGQIEGVYRRDEDRPFSTVGFLHDPGVTSIDPQHCAYLLYGEQDLEDAVSAADEKGVELKLVAYFEECNYYLVTGSRNMLDDYK